MGDFNQLLFVESFLAESYRRVLEVGSKRYKNSQPYRKIVQARAWVGVDMIEGEGVEVLGDLSESLCGLEPGSFDAAICASVLEHARDPWGLARNVSALLEDGGSLYVSAPFIQRYHPYPSDFWRFTKEGLKVLFPDFKWVNWGYSTTARKEFLKGIGEVQRLHLMRGERKYLPQTIVHLCGRKNGDA